MSGSLILRDLRSTVRGPFSATFEAGSCAVISGPSGIGKSLLLRMIADLDPNDGEVRLGDADRRSMPAPHWRRLVTYLAAEPGWWAEILADHMADATLARRLFPKVGLDPALLDQPVARLSTGERQRAALIRAIVRRPRFLLLDEPTSALDPASKGQVEEVLRGLVAEGLGLVVVSHDAGQADRLADRQFSMRATGLEPLA